MSGKRNSPKHLPGLPFYRSSCPDCRIRALNYNCHAAATSPKKYTSEHRPLLTWRDKNSETPIVHDFHCHKPRSPSDSLAIKQLICATVLTSVFMSAELLGGFLSNSLALMTDATHLVSDLLGFVISILAIRLAKRKPTIRFSFGLLRADVLGALISLMFIWVCVAVLVFLAIQRIIKMDFELHSLQMLVVAGIGIVVNVIIGIVLHSEICLKVSARFGHSHGGHGHTHSPRRKGGSPGRVPVNLSSKSSAARLKMEKNINVRAAFIHVLGDLLQSIGVFISALIIHIQPRYKVADPICTIIFSVITIITTLTILLEVLHVILEGVPKDIDFNALREELEAIDGVKHVHSLNIWSLTIDKVAVNVHLAIDERKKYGDVLSQAYILLQNEYDYYHVCVQVEPYHPETETCEQCAGP